MTSDRITAWRTDYGSFASSDDLVPWWSITKTVLAVSCLRLAEQGTLDLDARLKGRAFCVADLLRHQSGMASYTDWADYHTATERGDPAWNDAEVLARADALGPRFEVGEKWAYSNTGYLMVRQAIEAVTGKSIEQAIARLIWEPLEMRTAAIAGKAEDLETCRWLAGTGYDPKWVYHGLAVGSAADACRFMHSVGTGSFLNEGSMARLMSRIPLGGAIEGRPWETAGYGLGVMIGEMNGVGMAVGHSGTGPGSVSALYHLGESEPGMTVAAFGGEETEYGVEWEAREQAIQLRESGNREI